MKLGTRGSRLARWQADWVQARLAEQGVAAEIVVIKTRGDAEVDRPLQQMEGKGFFTKEIEEALLHGRIDVAVHSLKDLPTELPDGLALGAVPARHDPRDALIATDRGVTSLGQLPPGARVGTSSLRRVTQLRYLRPDVEVVALRGNVPTRVRKVEAGEGLDAALLALAGLARLELDQGGRASPLDPFEVMPAPGQGALGLEIRAGDRAAAGALRALQHPASAAAVAAERAVLSALGGGCQAPVAAYVDGQRVYGRVTAPDGAVQLTASAEIDPGRPERAGEEVARLLEAEGAASLLAR